MRLPVRLTLVGVTTLAATLVVVGFGTYELVRASGREEVDRALRRELAALTAGFPPLVAETGSLSAEALGRAARRYLAANPGSDRHLTVISFGTDEWATRDGPASLVELRREGELPAGRLGVLTTVDTAEGPVRLLVAPLEAGGTEVGRATIAGTLGDARRAARTALARVALAGAVGLVLGGLILALATRRALAPLQQLAEAARARSAGDAGARAPEPAREDEIGVLAVEFNRMLDRLAEGEETRRRLLAAVSHELRTPLAVARGHLEVATGAGSAGNAGNAESAEREELAVTLGAELERLSRIVDDLTALADAGALTTATGPVFVPDVLDALRERIAGLGVAGVEIRAAPPVVVEADEARLGQALMNLVVNAATHTGPSTRVLVEARVDDAGGDHSVCFAVTDDGPGIPEALRERVFEPFVTTRGDGSSPRAGLGLAVVKAFTEAQGGRVELRTGAGGTTVTIRLPAAR